jgi:hypothetical protein
MSGIAISAGRHLDDITCSGVIILVKHTDLLAAAIAADARTSERTIFIYIEHYRVSGTCQTLVKVKPGPEALIPAEILVELLHHLTERSHLHLSEMAWFLYDEFKHILIIYNENTKTLIILTELGTYINSTR